MIKKHPFELFLDSFVAKIAEKRHQLCEAIWKLETSESSEAADLVAKLGLEEQLLYKSAETYQQLLEWDLDESLNDSILKRQLQVLMRIFKYNQVPDSLLEEISKKEAALSQSYASFRPEYERKLQCENDILVMFKNELNPLKRQHAWEASKCIGDILSPQILELISLRNQKAQIFRWRLLRS